MEQRNLLLAIVVSVVILIGFQYLFEKMRPPTPATPPSPAATQTVPAPPAPGTTSPGATAPAAPGAAGGADQHAALARLGSSDRRTHRRSDTRDLSRNRRSEEPGGCAALAQGNQGPLFRRIRLGPRYSRREGARAGHAMDRLRRALGAKFSDDADLGQWRGPRVHAHNQCRRELYVHSPRRGEKQRQHTG